MATYRALPYGISDFGQIRNESLYLVDKSMYIETMEKAGHFLFLIRPRRFGKSLFLSMLRYYYDIAEKDNFQELFKGLWIAEHPTPNQGRFQVMHIDFSQIGGTIDELTENFDGYMRMKFTNFARKYAAYYPKDYLDELNKYSSASDIMNYVHDSQYGIERERREYLSCHDSCERILSGCVQEVQGKLQPYPDDGGQPGHLG